MQFVILCAGRGTRMEPLTTAFNENGVNHATSKPMLPIANRPALAWMLEKIDGDIVIVANKSQKDLIEFAQSRGIKIVFQEQRTDAKGVKTVNGTAGALLATEQCFATKGGGSFFEDEFVVMYGDDIHDKNEIKHISKQKPYCIGVFRVDNPEKYGVWHTEGDKLIKVIEKPVKPDTNLANIGLYKLDRKIFDYLKKTKPNKTRKEIEITDTFNAMIRDGHEFRFHVVKNWKTLSYPWHLLEANKNVLDKTGTIIGKNVEIRSGAYIEDPVAIGDNSIIGPNCFIRKYSSIGSNCRVGNAVEIKNSIIMDHSYVNHLAYVGDCIIGKNCNIGAGTIFANLRLDNKTVKMYVNGIKIDTGIRKIGGIIGNNTKVGVNVTVMPGKKIWPDLMIPACFTVEEDIEKQIPLKTKKRQ